MTEPGAPYSLLDWLCNYCMKAVSYRDASRQRMRAYVHKKDRVPTESRRNSTLLRPRKKNHIAGAVSFAISSLYCSREGTALLWGHEERGTGVKGAQDKQVSVIILFALSLNACPETTINNVGTVKNYTKCRELSARHMGHNSTIAWQLGFSTSLDYTTSTKSPKADRFVCKNALASHPRFLFSRM